MASEVSKLSNLTRVRGALPGDVILEVNGTSLQNLKQLRRLLSAMESGDPVVLQIQLGRELLFVSLFLD